MALPAFHYPSLGKFTGEKSRELSIYAQTKQAKEEELKAAYERIARLEADLNECREYLEDEVDVVDGDYGEPAPNRAMQLVTMIDETLHGPGNF
jgi:predicted  nucleic acid-binding Zn-ribbon protein